MDLSILNDVQRKAVEVVDGPILVVAGAGSGKTRVLTHRIANLIENHDIFPSGIMAITFTNKAANEMKTRIGSLIGPVTSQMWVGTFHSICVRILRRDADRIGYTSDFVIYDTQDQKALLKACYKELNIDDKQTPLKTSQFKISAAKNDMLTPELYDMQNASDYREKGFIKLYYLYQAKLKQNQAMDFDDLMLKTIELFKQNQDVLSYYQNKFKYIHVDEYQDTNRAQYTLIQYLAAKNRNLFVVGDADQSIYKWRGADIRNIREFEEDFPGAQIFKLEQNYRSKKNILDLANSVIVNNPNRRDKSLWTDQDSGEKIGYFRGYDEKDEAKFVIERIRTFIREKEYKLSDFAILYRTNAQSRSFEDQLMLNAMAYKVIGGLKFYERKEIKDLLAYMKLVVNPNDDVSFIRVINEPKRSIGGKTIEKIQAFQSKTELSLLESIPHLSQIEGIGAKAQKGLVEFYELIMGLKAKLDTAFVSQIYDELLEKLNIISLYELERSIEADARIDNIYEFKTVIEEFEKRSESPNLRDFLAETSLRSDQDNIEEQEDGVLLMTLHASKGLEFPVVFLVGLEDNLFPSFRAMDDPEELEEERRLCYVGITRAEERLFVTHARNRNQYGRFEPRHPSPFLREMDQSILENLSDQNEMPSFDPPKPKKENYFSKNALKSKQSFFGKASGTQGNTTPVASASQSATYFAGAKVNHKVFGMGLVISVGADGEMLTIAFDSCGIKKIHSGLAPIRRVD
ncbi:DNA helicase PcrA [Fusibacter ferrireducens]|uniref:ATP-dependent DNA helicase n=1 Tax=Fusibacter ferrireducens TaxID=2785058 RepID=A0ABR9ZXN3_9FIRM|nr:DNA helicase PcrA [Fusibacter ferrireducens]MBF4695225.1 DNA helicase PcrA [Fusibacter ferrireducens]